MVFVPEGQHDGSHPRSAWNHEENGLVPAGRMNRSQLRLDAGGKNSEKKCFSVHVCGTDNDFDRPSGTKAIRPSMRLTIMLALVGLKPRAEWR
jgi:hypothetical protein